MRDLDEVLHELEAQTSRLLREVEVLDGADLEESSRLPGWTRSHLLTHLAQNADAGVRLLDAARTGNPDHEYPSVQARAAAIEQGARRPPESVLDHVRRSARDFARACLAMTPDAWERPVGWTTGQRTPAAMVPRSRLVEVTVHHVDLDIGYEQEDWPARFVSERLDGVVGSLNRRGLSPEPLRLSARDTGRTFHLEAAGHVERRVRGTEAQLLAWLLGRSTGEDLATSDGLPLPVVPSSYTT